MTFVGKTMLVNYTQKNKTKNKKVSATAVSRLINQCGELVRPAGENQDDAFPERLTCFLLDFTQDVEEGRFHSVAVECMFPGKRSIHSNKWQHSQNTQLLGLQEFAKHTTDHYSLWVHTASTFPPLTDIKSASFFQNSK